MSELANRLYDEEVLSDSESEGFQTKAAQTQAGSKFLNSPRRRVPPPFRFLWLADLSFAHSSKAAEYGSKPTPLRLKHRPKHRG
jgi:hypothetical protein